MFVSCKSINLMPNANMIYIILVTNKFQIWVNKQYVIDNISLAKYAFGSNDNPFMEEDVEIFEKIESNITIIVDDIYDIENQTDDNLAIFNVLTECLRRTHFNIEDVKVFDKTLYRWIEYDVKYHTVYGITKIMESKNGEEIFYFNIAV